METPRLLLRLIAGFGLVLVTTLAQAQATTLEVIELKYRTAEQVLPVLQPLVPPPGSLTGFQNQLIVRTTPDNLAAIKQVLATIDRVPRQLLISVRQDGDSDRGRTAMDIGGRVTTGDAALTVPSGPGAGSVTVRSGDSVIRGTIDNTTANLADRNTQTLRVLEGNRAFIRVGQEVPVSQPQVTRTIINGQIVERVVTNTDYQQAYSGFYVLPRLTGDRVVLEISPQRDTLARPDQNLPQGSVNVERIATTVSGQLGEWIDLGGSVQSTTNQQSVLLGSTQTTASNNRRVLLKVEEIR